MICHMTVRMRSTSGKGGSRRSHHKIASTSQKEEGGVVRLRHRASRITGIYRGSTIASIEKRNKKSISKREKKIEERQNTQSERTTDKNDKKTTEEAEIPTL